MTSSHGARSSSFGTGSRRLRGILAHATLLGPLRETPLGALDPALERLRRGIVQQRSEARRRSQLCDAGAHGAGADHPEDRHRPRNSGLRFSMKAFMPSTRSSVAIASS